MSNSSMKKLSILISSFFFSGLVLAQQPAILKDDINKRIIISSASSSEESGDVMMSWTLGKSLHIFRVNDDDGEDYYPDFPRDILLYPNPATDHITIVVNDERRPRLHTILFDLTDRPLLKGVVLNARHDISLRSLPSAMYILRIYDDKDRVVKTFKILKN